jgi:hypothetical protein
MGGMKNGDPFARPAPLRGFGGRGGNRNDKLVGQTVVITQGRDKGLLGIVKESYDTTARVELHTNARIVTVSKDKLHVKRYISSCASIMMTSYSFILTNV